MPRKTGLRDYVILAGDDSDFFRQARMLAFEGVEAGPTREQLRDPGKKRLESLKKASVETGLAVPSLSLNHHNQGGLGSVDGEISGAAAEDVRQCFEWAQALGTTLFLIPFFGVASLQDPESRKRAVEHLKMLCREASPRGITLGYEGDLPAEDILEMAEEIRSPAFGCYFDLANPLVHGLDPVGELASLKELVVSIHIKDFRDKLGDCRPGEGRVPLEACAALLQGMDYGGWLILETPPAPAPVVAGDREYVKRVFGS